MIQFQNVRKSFGTQDVLVEASFTVNSGERVGIVGPNGAGKSTIFELIRQNLDPEKGEVAVPSGVTIGYVRQQLNPHTTRTSVLDYVENAATGLRAMQSEIHSVEAALSDADEQDTQRLLSRLGKLQTEFEHQGGYTIRSRAEATLSGLGFSEEDTGSAFRSFSGGWQMRAELARTLVAEPDILLLDEPTNYLDVPAVEWLQDYLRTFGGTLLLISHDRYLLNNLTSTTLEVMGGVVTRYSGNYREYMEARESRREQLLAAKRNQDRKREQLERFVERFRSKATKAAQAQSRIKMLEKMEDIQVPQAMIKPPKIRLPEPPRCGVEVFRLEQAGFTYDGETWPLRDVDLRIERGEKVAMVGLNGMGKTTLLRVLAGQLELSRGRRIVGHHVAIGYQSQEFTHVMDPNRTVYETARSAAVDRSDADVRDLLGGFGFGGDAIDKPVAVLSGGEKVRLSLARLLLQPCNVLILDEPTTHLDIHAREALEEALAEYGGTVCVVSHDIEFVRRIAGTVFALSKEGVRKYFGNYDYYRQKLAEESAGDESEQESRQPEGQTEGASTGDRRKQRQREAKRRQEFARQRRPLERRIKEAEDRSERLEAEKETLCAELQTAEPNTDFAAVNKRLAEIDSELEAAMKQWEEDSMALEDLRRECGLESG